MAPVKFEEHVKEKLDEREIQPSAAGWDKLSSRLDDSEKSSGRKLWISAIAAMVVLLIASTLYIDKQRNSFPVVDTSAGEEIEKKENSEHFKEPVQIASEEEVIEKRQVENRSEIIGPGTMEKKQGMAGSPGLVNSEKREEVILKSYSRRPQIESISIEPAVIAENPVTNLSSTVQEVLKKIKIEQDKRGDLTDAEVDALLAEAARDISNQRSFYAKGVVSADALLADVEYEVDQSFRKEVFDFLKEEFLKAKTAVATRNE